VIVLIEKFMRPTKRKEETRLASAIKRGSFAGLCRAKARGRIARVKRRSA
jgi:hypothetical protein